MKEGLSYVGFKDMYKIDLLYYCYIDITILLILN